MVQMPAHNSNNKSSYYKKLENNSKLKDKKCKQSNKLSHRSPNFINMHIYTYNIRTFREKEKQRNLKKKY